MKNLKKIAAVFTAILLVFSLASCDMIQDAEITPALDGIDCTKIQLGIIFSDDNEKEGTDSFIHQQAINKMQETYGLAGVIVKNRLDPENTEKVENAIISCVKESGCNVVISTDPRFTDIVYKFACDKDYSNIIFSCCDNTFKYDSRKNFNCYYPNVNESYCLAGVIAASKTPDGNIPVTLSDKAALTAFKNGVATVSKNAKVISGADIGTYANIDIKWSVYYLSLFENITLGKFGEFGNFNGGVAEGVCGAIPTEEYEGDGILMNLAHAKANFTSGTWEIDNQGILTIAQ